MRWRKDEKTMYKTHNTSARHAALLIVVAMLAMIIPLGLWPVAAAPEDPAVLYNMITGAADSGSTLANGGTLVFTILNENSDWLTYAEAQNMAGQCSAAWELTDAPPLTAIAIINIKNTAPANGNTYVFEFSVSEGYDLSAFKFLLISREKTLFKFETGSIFDLTPNGTKLAGTFVNQPNEHNGGGPGMYYVAAYTGKFPENAEIAQPPTETPTETSITATPTGAVETTSPTKTPETHTPVTTEYPTPAITSKPLTPNPTQTPKTPTSPPQIEPGDADCSGEININDILLVRDVIFGDRALTPQGYKNLGLEVNDDVNIEQILFIRDMIFGKE